MYDILDSVMEIIDLGDDDVMPASRYFGNLWDSVECAFLVGDVWVPVAAQRYADGSIVIVTFYDKGYRQREVPRDAAAWEIYEAMAVAAFRRANPRQSTEVVIVSA